MAKPTKPIDKLLEWAYRHELPKGYRDGSTIAPPQISPMFKYAALGGPVDNWAREPGFPIAMGTQPHDDALTINAAVEKLADVTIAWNRSSAAVLLGDRARHVADDEVEVIRRFKESPGGLVALHARLGNRPIWRVEYELVRFVGKDRQSLIRKGKARNSKNLLGNVRIKCPGRTPSMSDIPDAAVVVRARFEWLAWHYGLRELARTLDLTAFTVLPPEAPAMPWFEGEGLPVILSQRWMTARELATGRASILPRLPLKPARPRASPPDREGHGPMRHVIPEGGTS